MKINKIKINSYGKLKEKEIEFKKGINIVYGHNEAGKSTLINFIINSFYGISKNKRGKEISDYDKYKPWLGEDFSGKVEYELDNKQKFEIYRDFNKKNPKIYNENMEDISKQFNIDKNKGNEFFYEQTKIDEDLFLSTLAINQNEVKLESPAQNFLIQKIANLAQTGDDSVSFKRIIDRINRRQLDEIGTDRSREKPINILERNIQELKTEKQKLDKYVNLKYEFDEEEKFLYDKIQSLEYENNFLREKKLLSENEKIENEKIKIKENLIKTNSENLNVLNEKIKKLINKNDSVYEKNFKIKEIEKYKLKKLKIFLIFIFIILIIMNILQFIYLKDTKIRYTFLLTIPTFLVLYLFLMLYKNHKIKSKEKIEKNDAKKINIELTSLENERKIINDNVNNLKKELEEIKNEYIKKNKFENEKIKNKYKNKIEEEKINNIIEIKDLKNINLEIEQKQKIIDDRKLELRYLDLDKRNVDEQLDNLSKIEEDLLNNNEKLSNLNNINKSMNLAKEVLAKSYEKMKNSVTPKVTENLSNNISKITDGKYNKAIINEDDGLIVELENSDYVSVNRLSIGTIDQLYLSLRLSMIDELSEEKVPILLDETFAFYDDERLKNILLFLNNEFSNRQIILFTCTNREKEILKGTDVEFNYISL